ncbi:OPT family oligopeptide transporter [Vulgatibacter sp.]|uniref:OPT family oligopeptide transporter n=1 Tax=Vulgatibacter sp. TaxID=1971226 RepID=UPI003569B500
MSLDPAQDLKQPSPPEEPKLSVVAKGESPEDREAREWLENVYQGDRVKQLSPRSIITGMLIGAVMSISNLYVGLKTGWGLGVTITACIIAFAVFKALEAVVPAYKKDHFTILENNTMASAASAAGYMASAGLVSAFPALLLTTGRNLLWWEMMLWLGAVSILGVFMAVPLKRQLINIDKLPFPTGTATAETLRSMHTAGLEAMQKAKSLLWAAVGGAIVALWRDAPFMGNLALPGHFPLFPGAKGKALEERLTFGVEGSLIMVAAGAIMGIRVGWSLLLGAVVYFGVIGPMLLDGGVVQPGYRGLVSWTLWPATSMMVTGGLLAFGLRWKTVLRAFSGLAGVVGKKGDNTDPLAHIEVPGSWFVWGTALSGAACVLMGHYLFDVSWWMGILAVLATFLLSVVAARATGETDVTPIGAMGKITQLTYGVIAPSNITTNLMTASVTAGAASHSADLLTDLKSGYLLGGNPRKQTIAQLFGVLAGTLLCVPVYTIIAKPEKLGSAELPAPAAQVWASVAKMLADGLDALPQGALMGIVVGGIIGIVLTLLEEFAPKYRKWIPSTTGLGIAGVIPAFNSISMFLGALGAWILMRQKPKTAEKYTVAVSSGLIAGESLMGVAIILALQGPGMIKEILAHLGF